MSSKKVPSKETKPAAKKAAAKPAPKAVAKPAKAAPAKKTAAASAASKPAKANAKDAKAPKAAPAKPANKAVAKAAPKAPAAKPAAKPAKVASVAKPVSKGVAKPAPKAPAKSAKPVAKSAKPVAKPEKAASATKSAPKAAAKPVAKPSSAGKPVAKPSAAKTVTTKTAEKSSKDVVAAKSAAKKPAAAKSAASKPDVKKDDVVLESENIEIQVVKDKKGKTAVEPKADVLADKSAKGGKKPGKAPDQPEEPEDEAILAKGVKRFSKTVMFVEIDEQEDRSNKKKMSSEMKNLEMKPTASIRHKIALGEETQEELTERILKELEEQNLAFEREAASQMCTRCNRNLVSPEFWVDKHLGYCEECAMILKLGQSKEARKVEYQLGSMGGDSLDEEDDDILGPDADDLKEAEEDLADMED